MLLYELYNFMAIYHTKILTMGINEPTFGFNLTTFRPRKEKFSLYLRY